MGEGGEDQGRVRVTNRSGSSPFIVICDHASNWLPKKYGRLGLSETDLLRHIGWDPGALPVAEALAKLLDAPLVASGVSRLAIDCNRPLHASDLIPAVSETTVIPGNVSLSDIERAERITLSWQPFHDAIERLLGERAAEDKDTRLISIHSFTPTYKGISRPWEIGVLHDEDERLSAPLIAALQTVGGITIGDNQPYSPADNVYYTLEAHGRSRNLPCVMIEIRNDEITDVAGQQKWAGILADVLAGVSLEGIGAGSVSGGEKHA